MSWYDLPEVVLIEVINHLPVKDQLNARLVCRYWKQITDSSVRRDELILFLESYPRPVCWHHDGTEANLGNAFLVNKPDYLSSEFPLRFFHKLRRLMIVTKINTTSKQIFEQVQSPYKQLEHLQFTWLTYKCLIPPSRLVVYKTKLHLVNLRTFYSQAGDLPIGLHCPKLIELYVNSHLNISEATDRKTRLCIQGLKTLLVHKLSYPPNFEFSNLEVFYFNEPSPSITLSDFPCLKEIHYLEIASIVNQGGLKDALNNLLEQKRSLKRDQLRVYFDGFELNTRADLQVLEAYRDEPNRPLLRLNLNESVLPFMKENSLRLKFSSFLCKELRMSDRLDDELIGLCEVGGPVESMFRTAQCIIFDRPLAKESLNLFELFDLFRYVCVVSVHIELSQVQLDRLSDALPNLVFFYYHPIFFQNHFLNFQFIAKFKSLHCFRVYHHLLSIDELRLVLKNCRFINRFIYEKSNGRVEISRPFCSKVFKIRWRSSNFVPFASATLTIDELLCYLEASKWVEKKNDFLGERKMEEPAYLRLRRPPAQ